METDSQNEMISDDEISQGEGSPSPPPRFPSYYYGDPSLPPSRFPRWLPTGCGLLSIGALVVLFALGRFFVQDGLPTILSFVFSNIEEELDKQFAPDVPASERQTLKHKLDELASAVSKRTVSAASATKILKELQSTVADGKVSRAETHNLTVHIGSSLAEPATPSRARP